jgi:hypothetical protein
MIIAIDFDGTIGDANEQKAKWIKANLDLSLPSWQCSYTECVPIVGEEVHKPMGLSVYGREGTLRANEVSGALEALRALSDEHTLHIITARPEERIPSAREWLRRNDVLACIEEIHTSVGTTKATICSEIGAGILIDDDVRHLRENEPEGLMRILLQDGRIDRPDYGPGIAFCSSWHEILKRIKEAGMS